MAETTGMGRMQKIQILGWAALLGCGMAAAQTSLQAPPQPPTTTAAALEEISRQAGRILVGTVVDVHLAGGGRPVDWPDGERMMEITLQAEDCVRGCAPGQRFVLREWASLWRGQPHRYRVGQRAVWMLYPQSTSGVSSPVCGMLGVLPISAVNDGQSVDLRWLQTDVQRGSAGRFTATGTVMHPMAAAAQAAGSPEISLEQPAASLSTVMGVLHALAAAQASPPLQ